MSMREGAILGFGHVAAQGHAPAWRARADARIVAVADVDPARRALVPALLSGARVYPDATALLTRERLDFVDIAAPPDQHATLIRQALGAGCDVLCEKPLVTTLEDFRRVAQAARAANLALVTVHNWKHSEQFVHVADLVAGGAVGRLARIQLDTDRNGHSRSVGSSWRGSAARAGGGILFDHGWHSLYLMLALAPERPHGIRAATERRRGGDVEDTVQCHLELASSTAELNLTWAAEQRRTRWRVTGARGRIDVEEDRLRVQSDEARPAVLFPASLSAGSHHPDWFDAVIDDFFRAIDDPVERYANLAEAEWCLTLITLAYQSAASGRALAIPADLPTLGRAHLRASQPVYQPSRGAAPFHRWQRMGQ